MIKVNYFLTNFLKSFRFLSFFCFCSFRCFRLALEDFLLELCLLFSSLEPLFLLLFLDFLINCNWELKIYNLFLERFLFLLLLRLFLALLLLLLLLLFFIIYFSFNSVSNYINNYFLLVLKIFNSFITKSFSFNWIFSISDSF